MVEIRTKMVYEIFEMVDKAPAKQDKIDILKKYDSAVLRNILVGLFDDAIEWNIPPTPPPYTPANESSVPSFLSKQLNQLVYFVKGNKGDNLLKIKREKMFINLLESIHPKDAIVVLNMVAKKSPAKGLTKAMVKEVFPSLIRK